MGEENNIWVESEWAELKECVYGSPSAWVLPKFLDDARLRAQGEFGEFWKVNGGQDVSVVAPEIFQELSNQISETIKILENNYNKELKKQLSDAANEVMKNEANEKLSDDLTIIAIGK